MTDSKPLTSVEAAARAMARWYEAWAAVADWLGLRGLMLRWIAAAVAAESRADDARREVEGDG